MIKLIEKMHLEYFKYLPNKLNFAVYKIDNIQIINCELGSSMFNIAFGGINNPTTEKIYNIINTFNNQSFAWWIPPSERNKALSGFLYKFGLKKTNEDGMLCDLSKVNIANPITNLEIRLVQNKQQLQSFINILKTYDQSAEYFYNKLDNNFSENSIKFFVGFINNIPGVIGTLYINSHASSIFSLITKEHIRNSGYGTDMMNHLLKFAKSHKTNVVTLSASNNDGYKIYKRLGFNKLDSFECFEYIPN